MLDATARRAEEIDAHFDALLVDGMPYPAAEQVEEQRRQAHEQLRDEVMRRALAMPLGRPERW